MVPSRGTIADQRISSQWSIRARKNFHGLPSPQPGRTQLIGMSPSRTILAMCVDVQPHFLAT
jgi:hypothetical protein